MKLKQMANVAPALLLLIALFSVWELFADISHMQYDILPSPHVVFYALFHYWNIIAIHTFQTGIETLAGICFSILFGVFFAILLDSTPFVRKALYPILVGSQTIPMIACAFADV